MLILLKSKYFHCVEGSDLSHTQKILLPEISKFAPANIHSDRLYVAVVPDWCGGEWGC